MSAPTTVQPFVGHDAQHPLAAAEAVVDAAGNDGQRLQLANFLDRILKNTP